MPRELLHIYGPIAINTYGTTIALALLVFLWLLSKHPLRNTRFKDVDIVQVLIVGILLGVAGGRALFLFANIYHITSFLDVIDIWNGGFSVLGSVLSIVLFLPLYLRAHAIPVLPFFDWISIYAPLLQGLSRFGCFFAGCCYGKPTSLAWGIVYQAADTFAPQGICMHPTQLYSAGLLLVIFSFMYFFAQHSLKKTGQLVTLYLILISFERFTVDFWRDDQEFFKTPALQILTFNQWVCVMIASIASISFWYFSTRNKTLNS